ncbi:MAG: hypothetical protein ACOCUW_02660 [Gemmatimonadota bacterium]
MVTAAGGCDNVEWGGIDLDVVPPPTRDTDAVPDTVSTLTVGPILLHVRGEDPATIVPVGQVDDAGLATIPPDADSTAFTARFARTFLAPGAQLTVFRHGRAAGTVTIDSTVATPPDACGPLPRAVGTVRLDRPTDTAEFLALAGPGATPGTAPPPGSLERQRRMEVVGDMLANDALRARGIAVGAGADRQQLQPFPLAGSPDPGFTAGYLVGDSLAVGGDDDGAALFMVFVPRGQTGYDTAYVGFADYGEDGKAAPRLIDFMDWDGDGNAELLLEVFGRSTRWFRVVAFVDGRWQTVFADRCETTAAPQDTAGRHGARGPGATEPGTAGAERDPAPTGAPTAMPRSQQATPATADETSLDSIPDIQPQIRLLPETPRPERDTTPPDTGGVPAG